MIEIKQKTAGVVLHNVDRDTLRGANLSRANLSGARVTAEQAAMLPKLIRIEVIP